ncbi:hypothetical protein RJ641_030451 [Dillenia turbinata]|uniref:Uncharacterized protein n=1 Tax=Dillenia turbinata TaxID=194707 RepID=A0AAN8ZP33_9MAGN
MLLEVNGQPAQLHQDRPENSLLLILLMTSSPFSLALHSQFNLHLRTSTISAAPTILPNAPLASPPILSPDISPLCPNPGDEVLPPTAGTLPTIPSSPSPPNPDVIAAPGTEFSISPTGTLPESSSTSLHFSRSLNWAVVLGLVVCWVMQLSGGA